MHLHLIRHTKVNLPARTCYGCSDVPLMEDWKQEAEALIQQFRQIQNPLVYSSPLSRCYLLACMLSPKVMTDDRLKELNFGEWELKHWDEINDKQAENWMNNFVETPCPGGESYIDLITRVSAFLSDVRKTNHEEIVVVTHAGVIRAIISLVKQIPLDKSFEIEVPHGQMISLSVEQF